MKSTSFRWGSGGRLRAWWVAWLVLTGELCPVLGAENGDLASWATEATQALGDGDEARLVGLIERLTPETGRQVLGEVPIRAAEAGWTNAMARLLGKGLLTLPKAPESAAGSGPGPRFGPRPIMGSPMPGAMGPPWFVTATEVLAASARLGKVEMVRQILAAGTDSHGPMRMGSSELPPLLNAMRVSPERIPLPVGGRGWVTGSREDRRLCLDLLLRYGATLSPTNESGAVLTRRNPAGDMVGMSRFLDPELVDYALTNSRPVTRVDYFGRGLVHLAVVANRAAVIGPLVSLGAVIDQPDGNGHTPLHLLAAKGGVDPLSSSNSKPGLPRGVTGNIYRPNPELISSNRRAAATALLQSGARYDVFSAAGLDDTNALAAILQVDPRAYSQTNHFHQTPLHWAVQNVSVGAVAQLLAAGANPNAQDRGGATPMHSAVGWWPNSVLPLLIKAGASLEVTNMMGETPMMLALRIPEVLQALTKDHPAATPGTGRTNLFLQAIEVLAGKDALQTLFDAGERLEPLGPDGQPLIFWVLKQPIITDSLIFLAGKGLDVKARDSAGNTALHVMAGRLGDDVYIEPNSMTLMRAQLGGGESLRRSQQALKRMAARSGRRPQILAETRPLLDVLLEIGVAATATNHSGQTLLQMVTSQTGGETFGGQRAEERVEEALSIIRKLQARGLSADSGDKWGMTGFLEAVRSHQYRLALELVQLGANAKATNVFGESAFHLLSQGRWMAAELAATDELKSLVKVLLDRGLDPKLRNIHGLTAREEMLWNAGESRLEYYAQGDKPPGSRWPLVELVDQLGPVDAENSRPTTAAAPDYEAGAPRDLMRVFMGPQSGMVLEKLMDSGARLDFSSPDGRPLIHWILDGSLRLDLLPVLTLMGLDMNARDAAGRTVFDVHADRLGTRINLLTDPVVLQRLANKTPAASQALEWLRESGIGTPFVSQINIVLMNLLQKAGATGWPTNRWGQTVLHLRPGPSTENLIALIKPGAPLDARDRRGMTPLLSAVWNRQYSVAMAALQAEADARATNRLGDTAFHLIGRRPAELEGATIEPDLEQLIEMLLASGLDPRQRNGMELTPLEDARIWYRRESAQLKRGSPWGTVVILDRLENLDQESPTQKP